MNCKVKNYKIQDPESKKHSNMFNFLWTSQIDNQID